MFCLLMMVIIKCYPGTTVLIKGDFLFFFDDFTPDIKPFEDPKDCVSSGGADPLNIIKVGLRSDVKLFSEANCALLTLLCNNLCDCSRALQGFRVRSP